MTRIRSRSHSTALRWPLLAGALIAGMLGSCDNPACVFGPSVCQTLPGGGANAVTATFPETGELVIPSSPKVDSMFPTGFVHPESPLVVVFSESISPPSVEGAFEFRSTAGIGTPPQPNVALIGDGRVAILSPLGLVPGQEYQLAFRDNSEVRDLSGALALRSEEGVIGTFTVDADPSDIPQVVMTWPLDNSVGASTITEVITVFNRILDPLTITAGSWNVLVDGIDPVFDPLPEPLLINSGTQGGGALVQDTRVWRWRSIDTAIDSRVALGEGALVTIELSTAPFSIATPDGDTLLPVVPEFTTGTFSPPSALAIQSEPTDAIGIENLDGMSPLMISVDFPSPAEEGDVLEIFMVGGNPSTDVDAAPRISLQREVVLTAGMTSKLIGQSELMLLGSVVPLVALFNDGDIGIAFAIRRGNLRSALRVLDVDLGTEGIQDPVLDLVIPEFLGLLGKLKGEAIYASDLRELSIIGFGSEEPRSVEVIAMLSSGTVTNRVGMELPPLPSFDPSGTFVAAPVHVGQIPSDEFPVLVDVILYDKALNASVPFTVQYTQRGSSGIGTPLVGSGLDVNVVVYDEVTLEPIVGASVYSHESVGGVITAFAPPAVVTDANGAALVQSAPSGETLITIEAPDYNLFTFQGVPTTRLDIPLTADGIALASSVVGVSAQGSALSSAFIDSFAADSRRTLPGNTVREADACTYNTLLDQTTCTFMPPLQLRAKEIGLVTFLATKEPSDLNDPDLFSAGTFLQVFELSFPRFPQNISGNDNVGMVVGQLLSGADVDPQDIPLGTSPQVFIKPPNFALDFPAMVGDPLVSVEAFTPGIGGMMTAGIGRPYFDAGNDRWDIRAAYSARAKAGGDLATTLTIEDERLLRVEIVDASGNRSGVRQAMSSATGSLSPPGVPLLTAPAGVTGGAAYDLVFENTLDGAQDTLGLYHVLLVDSVGRRWQLWTPDPPTASGNVVLHVPPIAIQGGTPLGSGTVTCFIDGWSWPSFDPEAFMFSDIIRRHDRFTSASPKVFSQP